MKRSLCLIMVLTLTLILTVNFLPVYAEDAQLVINTVCESENIEVGDQFMVNFELADVKPYLTFQIQGEFDSEVAQIIAPVYMNEVIGVLQNSFDNDNGTFSFAGYDQTVKGTSEKIVCSILFEAKKAGTFRVVLGSDTMIGKHNENAFYVLEKVNGSFDINEDSDGEKLSIIEDPKPMTPFDDMAGFDWAEKAVKVMYTLGVIDDIADVSYFPGENITRGDFITMLVRICKLKTSSNVEAFNDADESSYQYQCMMIAKALGIAKGDENGNFRPDEFITRQDVSALVYRTMLKLGNVNPKIDADEYIGKFSDNEDIFEYAREAMAGLVRAKILLGDEAERLRPLDNMNRAEAAVMLNRLAEFNILIS